MNRRSSMTEIALQPEERATLLIVQVGLYPPGLPPNPTVLRLMALRMLAIDERGNPRLTAMAESALVAMQKKLH